MTKPAVAAALQLVSTLLLGLMAGFFFAFAIDVAPAMRELDAQTYITTQQAINRVVRNATFAAVYFGSALLPLLAGLAAHACGRVRLGHAWLAVWALYFGAVFWVTREVNVPINNALALWNPALPPADWMAQRDAWNQANGVRAVAASVCFGVALILSKNRL
jgi:uncharacterized membrane protein